MSRKKPRVCFFAHGFDRATLERTEFYRQDLDTLRGLDVELQIATSARELPLDADLYFAWWWTWAFQPALIARLRSKPLVITGVFGDLDYAKRPFWERWLMAWSLRQPATNVMLSRLEATGVAETFGLRNCIYLPLGVDSDLYRPNGAARQNHVLTICWMHAKNAKRKRIADVIRAVPRLRAECPDVRVTIAGAHESGYPELAALARELGVADTVEFPGVISREEKIRLMATSKVYLQPSLREGFGLAILEAMSCGAAVVSNPVGAVPEVVGDAGVLVTDTSPNALADAVLSLLGDDERRESLGRRARARAVECFPLSRRREALGDMVIKLLRR
jgi:glycosyltransferase involved in cell wall biosynthesis